MKVTSPIVERDEEMLAYVVRSTIAITCTWEPKPSPTHCFQMKLSVTLHWRISNPLMVAYVQFFQFVTSTKYFIKFLQGLGMASIVPQGIIALGPPHLPKEIHSSRGFEAIPRVPLYRNCTILEDTSQPLCRVEKVLI